MTYAGVQRRPSGEVLLNKGILHTQSAAQEKLQRLVASDRVKHFLGTRPSLREVRVFDAGTRYLVSKILMLPCGIEVASCAKTAEGYE